MSLNLFQSSTILTRSFGVSYGFYYRFKPLLRGHFQVLLYIKINASAARPVKRTASFPDPSLFTRKMGAQGSKVPRASRSSPIARASCSPLFGTKIEAPEEEAVKRVSGADGAKRKR